MSKLDINPGSGDIYSPSVINKAKYMILDYCEKALSKAQYKKLNDGTWFAELHGFNGVWANGDTVEACRNELLSVLEEWLVLKLRDNDFIPEIDGIGLDIREMMVA